MTSQNVYEWAEEYDQTLSASDSRFQGAVQVVHLDGSSFFYQNAFGISCEMYLVVFTEHHKFHVFHDGDIVRASQWGPQQTFPEVEDL